ncbi:MAG: response regulator [Phenylobacterium sp.]|uniref:response regulator n=1 Tax=Phenylobacterium sp. TaxID=1871053 RepID=UPI002715CC5D|nr:response regulator [Phenylobacterium sp.]MDO8902047.1 response regulator [Phenylobacterium sp.]MDP2213230.1 response regulator [Phenylobacterium sp.]
MSRMPRIVVADSDRALLEMLQIRLDLAGYETLVARNGRIALDLVKVARPCVLISEIQLPELDGFGLLEELRLGHDLDSCQVMMMARRLAPEDVRRAAVLGVKTCVAKPFSGADMLDRVAKLSNRSAPAPPKACVWV